MEQRYLQAEIMDSAIVELSLCNNEIGSVAMQALGDAISGDTKFSGTLSSLKTLNLCRNKIGNKGAIILATAFVSTGCAKV